MYYEGSAEQERDEENARECYIVFAIKISCENCPCFVKLLISKFYEFYKGERRLEENKEGDRCIQRDRVPTFLEIR
jgi:hypothetical protein